MHQKNKSLTITLASLCCVAIALAVVVIVNHFNPTPETSTDTSSETSKPSEEEEKALRESYNNAIETFKQTEAKVAELLAQDPIDVQAVVSLYAERINQCLANNEVDRAGAYITSERENLLSKNFKKEALDALTAIDYSVFVEAEQYRRYTTIISLAEELGENEIVSKYEPLAAKTKAAYDANYAASEKAAAEGAEARKNSKPEPTTITEDKK